LALSVSPHDSSLQASPGPANTCSSYEAFHITSQRNQTRAARRVCRRPRRAAPPLVSRVMRCRCSSASKRAPSSPSESERPRAPGKAGAPIFSSGMRSLLQLAILGACPRNPSHDGGKGSGLRQRSTGAPLTRRRRFPSFPRPHGSARSIEQRMAHNVPAVSDVP
jgi:hypothetical protein